MPLADSEEEDRQGAWQSIFMKSRDAREAREAAEFISLPCETELRGFIAFFFQLSVIFS